MKKAKGASDRDQKLQDTELSAERAAKVDSVLRILADAIEKLKISLILPRIFENPITLRQYLSETEYAVCLHQLEQYLKDKCESIWSRINPKVSIQRKVGDILKSLVRPKDLKNFTAKKDTKSK